MRSSEAARTRTVSCWLAMLVVALAASSWAGQRTFYHDVNLRLEGALFRGEPSNAKDLELYLGTFGGKWNEHVLGWAGPRLVGWRVDGSRAYNAIDHEGVLTEVRETEGRLRLVVDMAINADPWVPGGPAEHALDLSRTGNAIAGTFTGTFKGEPVKGKVTGQVRAKPWPGPVGGYVPLQPKEHPRLIFRKDDLPALKRRAKTPEGQAILKRLDLLLERRFTLWHAMGYGLKFQLTGETKYADLARKHVEMARAGTQQRDSRYSWTRPGGRLRAGSSFAAIAMAYDLCYEAWEPAYRRGMAKAIQDKVSPWLVIKTRGGQHSPRSNHYGAWNGGGGTAILAITGDPGTDPAITARCNRIFRQRVKRAFYDGYGDKAYFLEGHHCGRLSTNTGLSSYLQALRVAAGEDYTANYEPAHWLLTKWVYELTRHGGGMSSGGDFAQSFGICPEAHKPAVLWLYNHVVEPGPHKTYDAITYPHRAVYAFVNWPIGVKERNPAELFPKVLHDRKAEYFVFRSGWKGDEDVVVTLIGGERRPYAKPCAMVLGRGVRADFPGRWTDLRAAALQDNQDGSYVVRAKSTSFAVDFSGKCGAPLLVAAAGPGIGGRARDRAGTKTMTVAVGGRAITVMTLQKDGAPETKVEGDKLVIGGRTVQYDGKRLTLGE